MIFIVGCRSVRTRHNLQQLFHFPQSRSPMNTLPGARAQHPFHRSGIPSVSSDTQVAPVPSPGAGARGSGVSSLLHNSHHAFAKLLEASSHISTSPKPTAGRPRSVSSGHAGMPTNAVNKAEQGMHKRGSADSGVSAFAKLLEASSHVSTSPKPTVGRPRSVSSGYSGAPANPRPVNKVELGMLKRGSVDSGMVASPKLWSLNSVLVRDSF